MRHLMLAAISVALFACAAARLSHEVKPYVGRDYHELIARLGKPTGKRETSGDLVYVWSVSSEGVLPGASSTDGTHTSVRTVEHECTLEITVSADNIILSYQVEGSDAGCAAFRRHLSPS